MTCPAVPGWAAGSSRKAKLETHVPSPSTLYSGQGSPCRPVGLGTSRSPPTRPRRSGSASSSPDDGNPAPFRDRYGSGQRRLAGDIGGRGESAADQRGQVGGDRGQLAQGGFHE